MADQIDMFREASAPLLLSREWAMPSADTFSIEPIRKFIRRHYRHGIVSIDPFARNSKSATYTNDLNPKTAADYHMDATEFCAMLAARGVKADLAFFDPPYSPRQISEVYQSIGRDCTTKDTQSAVLYRDVRDALNRLLKPGGIVLSFG
jgi:16S rRNA G966 N2-methylase RsmD